MKALRYNILRTPLVGKALLSQPGRLVFQIFFLAIALLVIYDGFTGPQLAPANNATVLSWVHYRGFVILALLLFGNLYCAVCPFAILRSSARQISRIGKRFPRYLRNKWVSVLALVLMLWLYEWLDLWASPLLTAWIVIAYFIAAIMLEAFFKESPFCKYVCPLGAFNYTYAMASPTQISAADLKLCVDCAGKECINGSAKSLGCGTELYVPVINSNMDCTLCLDCARACPYDNVKLSLRKPLIELRNTPYRARWDQIFLISSLTFMAILNAFGMVPPVYALQNWMAEDLGIPSDPIRLLIIFIIGIILLPSLVIFLNAWVGKQISKSSDEIRTLAGHYSPALVPLGFGIWLAHYGFHFAIGGLTIIPVLHTFLLDHNVILFGTDVNWGVGFLIPEPIIFPLQVAAVLAGFAASLIVLAHRGMGKAPGRNALGELLPWAITLMALTVLSLSIFNMPMEMRGAIQ